MFIEVVVYSHCTVGELVVIGLYFIFEKIHKGRRYFKYHIAGIEEQLANFLKYYNILRFWFNPTTRVFYFFFVGQVLFESFFIHYSP